MKIRVSPRTRLLIAQDPERWATLLREANLPERVREILADLPDRWEPPDRPVRLEIHLRSEEEGVRREIQRVFGRLLAPRRTRKDTSEVGDLPTADVLHGGESEAFEAAHRPQEESSTSEGEPSPLERALQGEEVAHDPSPSEEGEMGERTGGSGEGESHQPGGQGSGLADPEVEIPPDPLELVPPLWTHPQRWQRTSPVWLERIPVPEDLIARLRAVFSQAIWEGWKEGEGGNLPGPRWDARRVAARIAGYLRPIGPESRRLEYGRPALLVMADVSASIPGKVASQAVMAAMAAGRAIGRDVVVAATYNGVPLCLWTPENPSWREVPYRGVVPAEASPEAIAVLVALARNFRVRATVVFGDAQNTWMVRVMADYGRVFWADNFRCGMLRYRGIPTPQTIDFPPGWLGKMPENGGEEIHHPAVWPRWVLRRIRYAYGCGTAEDFVRALEYMLQGRITRR